jgi:hypothetical protein
MGEGKNWRTLILRISALRVKPFLHGDSRTYAMHLPAPASVSGLFYNSHRDESTIH